MTSIKKLKKLSLDELIKQRDYYINEIRKKVGGLHMHSIGMTGEAFMIVNTSLYDEGVAYRYLDVNNHVSRIEDNRKWIGRCITGIKNNTRNLARVEEMIMLRMINNDE